jgi:hypothetical protein
MNEPGTYVQVYSARGDFRWQETLGEETYGGVKFGVSANDEYIIVYTPKPKRHIDIFETADGRHLRRIEVDSPTRGDYFAGGVSNDGLLSYVTFVESPTGGPSKSSAHLYYGESLVAEFYDVYDGRDLASGAYNVILSEAAELVLITAGSRFRIFKLAAR